MVVAIIYLSWFIYHQIEYSKQEKVVVSLEAKKEQNREEFYKLSDLRHEIKMNDYFAKTDSLDTEISKRNKIGEKILQQIDSVRNVKREINAKSTFWIVR